MLGETIELPNTRSERYSIEPSVGFQLKLDPLNRRNAMNVRIAMLNAGRDLQTHGAGCVDSYPSVWSIVGVNPVLLKAYIPFVTLFVRVDDEAKKYVFYDFDVK